MYCYRHPQTNANGICKSCNKGLCMQCAVDVENGLACKHSCEQYVKDINELIKLSKGAYNKTSSTYYRMAVIYGLLGIFFILFPFITRSFFPLLFDSFIFSFLLPIGIIFFIGMIFMFYSGMQLKNKIKVE